MEISLKNGVTKLALKSKDQDSSCGKINRDMGWAKYRNPVPGSELPNPKYLNTIFGSNYKNPNLVWVVQVMLHGTRSTRNAKT